MKAGEHFKKIHDLCWQADAAVRSAEEMKENKKKEKLTGILREIQAEEKAAMEELGRHIG